MGWPRPDTPNAAGRCDSQLAAVGDAMAKNFAENLELGANFTAIIDGVVRVNIYAGYSDKEKSVPWTDQTLACVYSSGKAALALLIAREVSRGRLDYEAPVSQYWPEFGQAGKGAITVAQALSHQAGLCGFVEEQPSDIWLDWAKACGALAAMAPLWPPCTANGYHPQTFGHLAGELLRRVTGKSVGALIRDFELPIHCGLTDDQVEKSAFMPKPPQAPDLGELTDLKRAAFLKPWSAPTRNGSGRWARAEIPASNIHANAYGLAAISHPLANEGVDPNGEQILATDAVDGALAERIRGDDLILPFELSWAVGLMRNINKHFGPNVEALGHAGFGGSCVVIDPINRLTAAYVMNKMSPDLVGDARALRLINALYASL